MIEKTECVSLKGTIRITIYSLSDNKYRFLNSFYYIGDKDIIIKAIDKTVKEIMDKLEIKWLNFYKNE